MFYLKLAKSLDINTLIIKRVGEKKLGESMSFVDDFTTCNELINSKAKYVLIGIEEDKGVKVNKGIGGAATGFEAFLKSFLNIQANQYFDGREILLLGSVTPENNHYTVEELDDYLAKLIGEIFNSGKMPIVIGGGHNNCYPILKAYQQSFNQVLNVANIDPHADFRRFEGRHSGNGFSYAKKDGYLNQYFVLGLHEAYNYYDMLLDMEEQDAISFITWEDIFMRKKITWSEAIQKVKLTIAQNYYGIELDLDSMENVLSSAVTPVGIQTQQAMEALYELSKSSFVKYLHLPEGIALREDGRVNSELGKLLSYLVQAFIKGNLENKEQ